MDLLSGSIVAKVLYDASNGEIVFPDVEESEEIKVGDEATIDGQPANGVVVLSDGRTLTFVDGVLTEIEEADDAADESAEKIAELESEIANLKAEIKAQVKLVDGLKKENEQQKSILAKIKKIKSDFQADENRERTDGQEVVQSRFKKALKK